MLDYVTFAKVLPSITPPEKLVFLFIYRQTIGWKQDWSRIPISKLKKWTGYRDKRTIITAVKDLEKRDLIEVKREAKKANEYRIKLENIDTYQEKVS